MKAEDLIKKLKKLDPETDICVGCADNDAYGYDEFFHLEVFQKDGKDLYAYLTVTPYSTSTDTQYFEHKGDYKR